jgi:four helix bundle protein
MKPSPVREKSFRFAVNVVRLCRSIRDPLTRPLMMQFMRAGTSVAANVEEAGAAQSRKDFLSKMCIASKEAREANFWIRVLRESSVLSAPQSNELLENSSELVRLLTAIVRTTSERAVIASEHSKLKTKNSKLPALGAQRTA